MIGWLDGLVGLLPGDLRLYQALRQPLPEAPQMRPRSGSSRSQPGVVLLPAALVCSAVEIALGRSGTVYVEARLA